MATSIQMQSPVSVPSQPPQQLQPRYFSPVPRFQSAFQKNNVVYNATQFRPHTPVQQGGEFDGKRLRKAVIRKTIDYNSAILRQLELRVWQRDSRDQRAIQPDGAYYTEMVPPPYYVHNPVNVVTTKFVRTSTNKMRCPIFCVAWTPEGRRLVTGASSGEFTLWNGLTFNFETILQAHDSPVRCMVWSHTDQWMVTGDHAGFVKYWQSNMNNVKMFQAHKEPLRGISFCPTDTKFATCSDDGTVRIWDFLKCYEEKILRGHGADVKCLAWHPHKSLLVSGSKDSQQPIKLWDPKSGQSLATLHAHKSTVMEAKWNENGNWLLTGSRDHLIKLFDIRKLSQEVQTFRGHKKEVSSLAWHPIHESLFASGGSDGAVMFWLSGVDKEVGCMEQAHDSIVWSLAWHPLGHILCSGSNDHTCKFWTRNRPGDAMRDKYNLNMLVGGANPDDASEYDDISMAPSIPGMGLEYNHVAKSTDQSESDVESAPAIPGLDFGAEEPQTFGDSKANIQKKIPYSKPIPKQFQQQWMDNMRPVIVVPPPTTAAVSASQTVLPPVLGPDGQPLPSSNPPVVVPPIQHVMSVPPPTPGQVPPQRFPTVPPPPRMMIPGESPMQRMPMMWTPRMSGPDSRMRPPFPPIGNGGQFRPPPGDHGQFGPPPTEHGQFRPVSGDPHAQFGPNPAMDLGPSPGGFPNASNANNPIESKNWKEFGDSDFRLPMDSDMRLLDKGPDGQQQQPPPPDGNKPFLEDPLGNKDSPIVNEGQDQDMRTPMQDTDARMMDFQPGGLPVNNGPSAETRGGRPPGRRGRWGPAVNTARGSAPFNPPVRPFSSEGEPPRHEGDWDERIGPGLIQAPDGGPLPPLPPGNPMGPPGFQGQRKRPWETGPGMVDLPNLRSSPGVGGDVGNGGNNPGTVLHRDEGFGRGGIRGFPPTSQPQNMGRGGMPPWGPPRGGMRGGRMRGPFRGGPRGRMGMRGGRM